MIETEGTRPVFSTVMWFTVYYVLCNVLLAALVWATGIEMPSSIGIVVAMLSAAVAGQGFFMRHGSLPVGRERWYLVFGSLVASTLLSLAAVAAVFYVNGISITDFLASTGLSELTALAYAAIVCFVLVLYALVLWLGFGSIARMMVRSAAKSKA